MATGRIGVTPTLGVRWSKAPAGGTTSLSGLDDNSVSLVYSVGYEQVYRNGVLLSRGNDYTATNGTSITLIDATITGDIIEVFAQELVPLTDAISKGQFTAKGSLLSASAASTPGVLAVGSNNQVLTADSSTTTGLKWATPATGALSLVKRASFSAVANTGTTFDDVFTSTYSSYLIIIENLWAATATDDPEFQLRYAGPTTQNLQYLGSGSKLNTSGTVSWIDNYDEAQFKLGDETGDSGFPGGGQIFINGVGNASERATWRGQFLGGQNAVNYYFAGNQYNAQTYTGILFKSSSSNITGTISVYGMAKS